MPRMRYRSHGPSFSTSGYQRIKQALGTLGKKKKDAADFAPDLGE